MRVLATLLLCAFVCSLSSATPASAQARFMGIASVDDGRPTRFDSRNYHGRVATGARFHPGRMAVAHRTLPLGSYVRVDHGVHSAVAIVNDRGPCASAHCRRVAPKRVRDRVLDMTPAMARRLRCGGLCRVAVLPLADVPLPRPQPQHHNALLQMASADPDMPLTERSGSALDAGGLSGLDADAVRYGRIQKLHAFTEPLPPSGKSPAKGLTALKTHSGQVYIVAAGAAQAFSGFVAWLESTGYRIRDIGGYAYRRIAGTRTISNHARGAAIDINQTARNRVTQRLPLNVTQKAREFGLIHGAVWRRPDTGHFELARARRYAVIGHGQSIRVAKVKRHWRHHRHRHHHRVRVAVR